jgi:hypothetical protein
MDMETVTLFLILERLAPELVPFLTERELNMNIVLRDVLAVLEPEDAVEIAQHSICRIQKQVLLH